MKRIIALALSLASLSASAQVDVNGYYRNDGTYVQPHHRTAPNNTISDNYSTKGNINPYTGQPGTVVDHQAEYQYQMAQQQAALQRQMQQQQMEQMQRQQQMQLQQQRALQMQSAPTIKPPCNPYIYGSC